MEKINIAELLKDAPKGTKLYSPICGECTLSEVDLELDYPIIVQVEKVDKDHFTFNKYGRYVYNAEGECLLFPSENCRSWENFQAPWKHKHFEPFQKVLVLTRELLDGHPYYNADFYSHWDENSKRHFTVVGLKLEDNEILDYKSNEDLLGKEVQHEED